MVAPGWSPGAVLALGAWLGVEVTKSYGVRGPRCSRQLVQCLALLAQGCRYHQVSALAMPCHACGSAWGRVGDNRLRDVVWGEGDTVTRGGHVVMAQRWPARGIAAEPGLLLWAPCRGCPAACGGLGRVATRAGTKGCPMVGPMVPTMSQVAVWGAERLPRTRVPFTCAPTAAAARTADGLLKEPARPPAFSTPSRLAAALAVLPSHGAGL